MDTLYVVIPCYNEEAVICETASRLAVKIGRMTKSGLISEESRVVFVDDGSKDKTWEVVCRLHEQNRLFTGLKLSRNRGHQNALLAGLMYSKDKADATVSMDADLQDDIEVMDEFIKEYKNGCDVVYGVRKSRKTDSFFKRWSALFFYKLMKFLGADIVYNHADYRLLSRRALEALDGFEERNLFLRGVVPLLGFKSGQVNYDRASRYAGKTKYGFKKMLSFALGGITSFSIKPLKLITKAGFVISAISVLCLAYTIISGLLGRNVSGWLSIMWSLWILGGIQILCIGVIGEYLGNIYTETKKRPRYFIEDILE